MKIERLDIYWTSLPLKFSFRTSYGEMNAATSILVRMEGEGYHAWGETGTVPEPIFSSEHTLGVFHTVREHFARRIIGQDIESAQDILDRLAPFKGNEFAKACLEIPWWVLDAKRQGIPLHRLLGGRRDHVAVGADFGVQDSLDILLCKIQGAIDDGYSRVKLKFRPGWDLNMLDAVRSTFPDFTFHIDCNAAYTLADADLLQKVDRFHLAMIEQPLKDDGLSLYNHAELQKMIETPICLDESIHNLIDVQLAIRLKSCKIVNIKVARVGGISASVAIHNLCAEHDIPCWIGSMVESGIGGGINIEVATLPNFTYPSDIFPSEMFFHQELATPEVDLSGPAEMTASQVPGIPYEPLPELLRKQTVQQVSFEA